MQPDEIIRSDRKTLSLVIDPFGRLIVRAPKRCAQERIFAFIRDKEKWILRKQAACKKTAIELPNAGLDGYRLPILGEKYTVVLMDADTISLDIEQKILKLPKTKSEQRLVEWLKTNAERIFGVIAKRFSQQMSVQYKSLSVTSARTRWGSCSGENRLCFTFRLLFAPKEIVEYVVVHELAHIRHKNHSAKFWSEVEKYQPDWKNKRAWLKAHGGLMELF